MLVLHFNFHYIDRSFDSLHDRFVQPGRLHRMFRMENQFVALKRSWSHSCWNKRRNRAKNKTVSKLVFAWNFMGLNIPSHLTEDAIYADVIFTLGICFAHIFLHAFVRWIGHCFNVAFEHGNRRNAHIAETVLFANIPCGYRSMWKWCFQCIQQINDDTNEFTGLFGHNIHLIRIFVAQQTW